MPRAVLPVALLGLLASQPANPEDLTGGFRAFETPLPASAAAWEKRKPQLRIELRELLGEWPPVFTPQAKIVSRQRRDGYLLEKVTFDNGAGATVYGYVLLPERGGGQRPAVLYNHYHGGEYENGKEEVITKPFTLLDFATGETLARQGYVVLAIDAYCFGERRWQGPAGTREEGRATELSLFKTFLWEGRTLWGMIVRDDLLALNYLLSRPEADPRRVATMGMSMGSTRSWWLAALDERIRTVVSVACLTRYQNLIRRGDLARHSIYYFVPNLLGRKIDMETVIGLIAPRPHLTLTGDQDPGSPVDGVRQINEFQQRLYRLYGKESEFRGIVYPGVPHKYTPEMWSETIAWLKSRL